MCQKEDDRTSFNMAFGMALVKVAEAFGLYRNLKDSDTAMDSLIGVW